MLDQAPASRPLAITDVSLDAPPALCFAHTLSFLASFPPTRGEQHVEPRALTKALAVGDRAALVRVKETRAGLVARIATDGPPSTGELTHLVSRVRFWLSLDDDLAPFRALTDEDAPFAPVARRWAGHHHVKFPSLFEIAAWAVLAQRDQRQGRRAKDALVAALGPRVVVGGVEHRAFPAPEAALDAARVRAALGDAAKADALVTLARTFADPDVERALRSDDLGRAEAFLRDLPRIGPWSAAFILFRGLGRMERLAARSGPIVHAARRVYGPRSERDVRATAERYGPWCGYWALYLRRS